MEYNYGSRPVGYNYIQFIKYLAPVLPASDQVFLYKNSTQWRDNHYQIPLELFQNICHWKSVRRFELVRQNKIERVNRQWRKALQEFGDPPYKEQAIRNALTQLKSPSLDGIGVKTASALLTAWNPAEFGVMDYKVLEVLGMQQSDSARNYILYHNQLLELRRQYKELGKCGLRQIELALWHYHSIQKMGEKERPR